MRKGFDSLDRGRSSRSVEQIADAVLSKHSDFTYLNNEERNVEICAVTKGRCELGQHLRTFFVEWGVEQFDVYRRQIENALARQLPMLDLWAGKVHAEGMQIMGL